MHSLQSVNAKQDTSHLFDFVSYYLHVHIQSADSEINFRVVQGISVIAGVGPMPFKLKKSFKFLNFQPWERWVGGWVTWIGGSDHPSRSACVQSAY